MTGPSGALGGSTPEVEAFPSHNPLQYLHLTSLQVRPEKLLTVSAATDHVMQLLLVKSQLTPSCSVRESSSSVNGPHRRSSWACYPLGVLAPARPALAHCHWAASINRRVDFFGLILVSFLPLRYPRLITQPEQKLTPADPDDLADSLSFALRHEGRKSQHDSDKLNADIVAQRLVRPLDKTGDVVMKKPPLGGHLR